jgi:hypothetical protein
MVAQVAEVKEMVVLVVLEHLVKAMMVVPHLQVHGWEVAEAVVLLVLELLELVELKIQKKVVMAVLV